MHHRVGKHQPSKRPPQSNASHSGECVKHGKLVYLVHPGCCSAPSSAPAWPPCPQKPAWSRGTPCPGSSGASWGEREEWQGGSAEAINTGEMSEPQSDACITATAQRSKHLSLTHQAEQQQADSRPPSPPAHLSWNSSPLTMTRSPTVSCPAAMPCSKQSQGKRISCRPADRAKHHQTLHTQEQRPVV